jgi:segregation and condensation protein B
MEALAIVAYNQPVTRVFVDTLRRVDSSYAMNNLIDRGLIESKGRLDAPGRPMLYGTTPDFLRAFGLSTIDALPQTAEEIKAMFARIDNPTTEAEPDDQLTIFEAEIQQDEDLVADEIEITEVEKIAEAQDYVDETSAEDDIINDDI